LSIIQTKLISLKKNYFFTFVFLLCLKVSKKDGKFLLNYTLWIFSLKATLCCLTGNHFIIFFLYIYVSTWGHKVHWRFEGSSPRPSDYQPDESKAWIYKGPFIWVCICRSGAEHWSKSMILTNSWVFRNIWIPSHHTCMDLRD